MIESTEERLDRLEKQIDKLRVSYNEQQLKLSSSKAHSDNLLLKLKACELRTGVLKAQVDACNGLCSQVLYTLKGMTERDERLDTVIQDVISRLSDLIDITSPLDTEDAELIGKGGKSISEVFAQRSWASLVNTGNASDNTLPSKPSACAVTTSSSISATEGISSGSDFKAADDDSVFDDFDDSLFDTDDEDGIFDDELRVEAAFDFLASPVDTSTEESNTVNDAEAVTETSESVESTDEDVELSSQLAAQPYSVPVDIDYLSYKGSGVINNTKRVFRLQNKAGLRSPARWLTRAIVTRNLPEPMMLSVDSILPPTQVLGIDWGENHVMTFSNGYCLPSVAMLKGKSLKQVGGMIFRMIKLANPEVVVVENDVTLNLGCDSFEGNIKGTADSARDLVRYVVKRLILDTGIAVFTVGGFYASSHICCNCKSTNNKVGNVFNCPECGMSLHRDINAAVNLMLAVGNPAVIVRTD